MNPRHGSLIAMAAPSPLSLAIPGAAGDTATALGQWLQHLAAERGLSPKTLEAYGRDARGFIAFLAEHLGGAVNLGALESLQPRDLRAFMAKRRADGLDSRSIARALAAVRSFARFLEREGRGRMAAFAAVRTPKTGRRLPRPLAVPAARAVASAEIREHEDQPAWVLARDTAVLALLYGSGLRISEALGLSQKDAPRPGGDGQITVLGKGGKTRQVPVIARVVAEIDRYRGLCPWTLGPDDPLFRRGEGRAAVAAHHPARHGALARRAGPARDGDAARAAPFLRDPSAGARWRPALDPGTARPRLAVDDADLHRGRYGGASEDLRERASARVRLRPCGRGAGRAPAGRGGSGAAVSARGWRGRP